MRAALGLMVVTQAVAAAAGVIYSSELTSMFAAFSFVTLFLVLYQLRALFSGVDASDGPLRKFIDKKVEERTEELNKMVKRLEDEAITDALTGLLNRRGAEDLIQKSVSRCRRTKTTASFIIVDLDHFKKINDTYGHASGDLVLSAVATALSSNVRAADITSRWGGEEMLICLPDTNLSGALFVAEKLRKKIEGLRFDGDIRVTASFGCSELGAEELNHVLARADMNLYIAKARGRNCVFPEIEDEKT